MLLFQLMEATATGEHTNLAQSHVEVEPKRGPENAITHDLPMEERTAQEHHHKLCHVILTPALLMEATATGDHTNHAQSHVEAEPKRGSENAITHDLPMEGRTAQEHHHKLCRVILTPALLMEVTAIGEHISHAQSLVEAVPKRGHENAITHDQQTEGRIA